VGIVDELNAVQAERARTREDAVARPAAEREAEIEWAAQAEAVPRQQLAPEILGDAIS
jgi:hypothetical protein